MAAHPPVIGCPSSPLEAVPVADLTNDNGAEAPLFRDLRAAASLFRDPGAAGSGVHFAECFG
jgi:hypothetical protein